MGQQATDGQLQASAAAASPEYMERWAISEVRKPPPVEVLAEKTAQFYKDAGGIRVSQKLLDNGVLQYQAESYMAAYAFRTEVYLPNGSLYTAKSWLDGSVYEYRPYIAAPGGPTYHNVITRYDGTDLPEVTNAMLVPSEEACKVGNLSISWIAADDEEPACDAHVRYVREGTVVGETDIDGTQCWVLRRGFAMPDEDGMFTVEHLHFMDKHTGRPVRWVTTQTTELSSIERVREFEDIEVSADSPDVDWRLGDLVSPTTDHAKAKGLQHR